MLTLVIRLVLTTWLFISAFVLPHTTASAWNALVVASLMAAVSFLTFAMPGRPGFRWWNAVLATWLLVAGFVLPYASLATVFHDVVVAMLVAAVTIPLPTRWLAHWREEHGAAAR